MKAVSLVSCISFSIFLILFMSMSTQATEYRENNTEVNASDISKHIENGDDIYLDSCRIIGELNVSKMKLEIITNTSIIGDVIYIGRSNSKIENKILIYDSVFEKGLDFSNSLFKAPISFNGSTFNDSVDFSGSTFNSSTNFTNTKFRGPVDLCDSTFNGPVDFSTLEHDGRIHIYVEETPGLLSIYPETEFLESADFRSSTFNSFVRFDRVIFYNDVRFDLVKFNSDVSLTKSTFNGPTDFIYSSFNSPADFRESIFYGPSDFYESTFNDSLNLCGTNFNSSYLRGPKEFKEIITSEEKTCNRFREFYKNEARYTDADNIYYDYRKTVMNSEKITALSKWSDFLIFITCGYGVRPFRSFFIGGIIIGLFSIIYWQGSGIYRFSDTNEKKSKVSFLDALLFSVREFITVGSADWYPRDNFRVLVTLEGLLGWIMLGIFMATLTTVMIRL